MRSAVDGAGAAGRAQSGPDGNVAAASAAKVSPAAGPGTRVVRDAIVTIVAAEFRLPVSGLLSPTRGPAPVAKARQVAMYLTHVAGGLSLTDVGIMFGRDRTTVAHACGVVEDARDGVEFDRRIDRLEGGVVQRLDPVGQAA